MTSGSFGGKVVVVTGGSRGIVAAVVGRFAREGASVVIGYNSGADDAHSLKKELEAADIPCLAVKADVSETQEMEHLMDQAVDAFGRIDILAACAGISHFGGLSTLTPEAVDHVFAVNTRGQLLAAQHAADRMTDGGRIILTSSNAARRAVFEHGLYAASKAAIDAMVRCLSIELGPEASRSTRWRQERPPRPWSPRTRPSTSLPA